MNVWFIISIILSLALLATAFIFDRAIKKYKRDYFNKSSARDIANPIIREAGKNKNHDDQS